MSEKIYLIANGDLRLSANRNCWAAQQKVEEAVMAAVRAEGREVTRGHPYDPRLKHGFIGSQKQGIEVFQNIPPQASLIVCEAVWQYSHQVLIGLASHKGPILTVANWSGEWPGLVGMLNLNACMTKAGIPFSTLWSLDFKDEFFLSGLRKWLSGETVVHDLSHVHPLKDLQLPEKAAQAGEELAGQLRRQKAILGVFDEGCMGMYNGIIEDCFLLPLGVDEPAALSLAFLWFTTGIAGSLVGGVVYLVRPRFESAPVPEAAPRIADPAPCRPQPACVDR